MKECSILLKIQLQKIGRIKHFRIQAKYLLGVLTVYEKMMKYRGESSKKQKMTQQKISDASTVSYN